MLRAKEAVYGYAVQLGAVDEAWKVRAASIEEGLTPTMVEREQPQLLLVSTAHRMATALMLGRRQAALDELERGDGELLIEWSARGGRRPRGRARVAGRVAALERSPRAGWWPGGSSWRMAGEIDDPEEPDPIASFRAQWLNQWPVRIAEPRGQDGAAAAGGVWAELEDASWRPSSGAASGWPSRTTSASAPRSPPSLGVTTGGSRSTAGCAADWDSAIADVRAPARAFRPVRQLLVGASLLDRVPDGLGVGAGGRRRGTETRHGLALLRDLALAGQVVHDVATATSSTRRWRWRRCVRRRRAVAARGEGAGASGQGARCGRSAAAHRPAVVPAIY